MTRVPVLVVGAGPAGLVAAGELGRMGVETLLVDARTDVMQHPRARSVNVRTNEIFRGWGIEQRVREASLPLSWCEQMLFVNTLAGAEIGRVPMNTQGTRDGVEHSPCPWLLTSQDALEPILQDHLDGLPGVRTWRGFSAVEVSQEPDGVTCRLRGTDTGEERVVVADWVIAADGASSPIRKSLGISLVGRHRLGYLVNTEFHADLGPWTDHRPAVLYWTSDPARNVFQKIDTDGRWLCQVSYSPEEYSATDFDADRVRAWITASIGAEADIRVIGTKPWAVNCSVAERFRDGRVFLVGDAAHLLPPSGGYGMNSAVQDSHNLAWKLAGVVDGWAAPDLLDTYEQERRPLAEFNAEQSHRNGRAVARIRRIAEGQDTAGDAGLSGVRRYTNSLGMDIGFHYRSGAFTDDGTAVPEVDDPVVDYVPTARPGHRAPHYRLTGPDGPISTLDLTGTTFALVGGPASGVGTVSAGTGAPLTTHVLGHDLHDPQGEWTHHYGVHDSGAVLIRPDGIVAARWPSTDQEPARGCVEWLDALAGRDRTRPDPVAHNLGSQ